MLRVGSRSGRAPHARTGSALVGPLLNEPIAPARRVAERIGAVAPSAAGFLARTDAPWTRSSLLAPGNTVTGGAELAAAPVEREC